jgi:hypothetical protein
MRKPDRQNVEMLTELVVKHLHVITKLNFHREEIYSRNTVAYMALHPIKSLSNTVDLYFLQKNCTHFLGMFSELQQFEKAKDIHQKLSDFLGDKKTFFDNQYPNEEIKLDGSDPTPSGDP